MVYINGCPFVLREEVGLVNVPKAEQEGTGLCARGFMTIACVCATSVYRPGGCQVRPLKNMMEYAGIEAARIEAMEERLKKDVVAEVRRLWHLSRGDGRGRPAV